MRYGLEFFAFFFKLGGNTASLYDTVREANIADAEEKGEEREELDLIHE